MGAFDLDKFRAASLIHRTADVKVPTLAPFFADDAPAVWTVRQPTGHEIGRVDEEVSAYRADALRQIVGAVVADGKRERVDGIVGSIREAMGWDDQTPAAIVRRMVMVRLCTVSPEGLDESDVARLATFFPEQFFAISNEIFRLAGKGAGIEGE